ncbi:FMN-binding negative transcriptional regulator [Celeribacter sp.]|uniref:FMN-binding negative transcriptional regulator n=1 Tax=Celeribacter sp. TaxID=1890673 RepID=UPI003A8DDF2B
MYRPDQTGIDDPSVLRAAMHEVSFGALVTPHAEGIEITHVPWLVREEGGKTYLESHIARPNPHWKLAGQGQSVVMFQGPHAYISPSFYPSKQIHGKAVPTWGYIVAHAHGTFEAIQDGDWLGAHLAALTQRHEAGRAAPWAVSDAPVAYIAALKRGIVGLRFEVARMEGKWKINQNKSEQDRSGTYSGLMAEGGDMARDLAEALEFFPKGDDQ